MMKRMANHDGQAAPRANLILAGFMGTGKTSVGRIIAARWGSRFVDFDAELEARFGLPVAEIFAVRGEAAFRAAEADLCRALPPDAGWVAATGGGAVVDQANRAALQERGVLVCLYGRPEVLLARLQAAGPAVRPLLGTDPAAAMERLLAARATAYGAIPWQVDTSDLDLNTVAERVLALYAQATQAREDDGPNDG